jgi:AcrR family transcriptional regulator
MSRRTAVGVKTRSAVRRPASRSESKELTRRSLLHAALTLLSERAFDSLSLREVTREAGVSPTAFYRHFDGMEELGQVLVEESFGSLRSMVRDARAEAGLGDDAIGEDAIRRTLAVVLAHLHDHTAHFRFIARERYGGVHRLRRAIHRELQLFAEELAVDLAVVPIVGQWSADDRRMLSGLLVETMVHMVAELLDAGADGEEGITRQTEKRMRLITTGVPSWRSVGPG